MELSVAQRSDNIAVKVSLMVESWFGVSHCFSIVDIGSQR